MTRSSVPAAPARPSPRSLVLSTLAILAAGGLLVLTVASPGATRMFSSPWQVLYAFTLSLPFAILLLRAADPDRPLRLPPPAWRTAIAGLATLVFASALFSPYRAASLLWSAPLLAGVATICVAFDWLHGNPTAIAIRQRTLWRGLLWLFGAVAATSMALWLATIPGANIAEARNPFPLGHSNYTAGLALLALPGYFCAACKTRGATRAASAAGLLLTLAMLITSGSRAAVIGCAALAASAVLLAPLRRKQKALVAGAALVVVLVLAALHPRTRAMLMPTDPAAAPNVSNVQRAAMLEAAARMGAERPWLGWGPGTTPLAYPRFRAHLDGGAENVLQLHSTPAQVWAELGGLALFAGLALAVLLVRAAPHHPVAATSLAGYAVFSVFDWQLDVPIFPLAVAVLVALLVPPPPAATLPRTRRHGWVAAAGVVSVCGAIVTLGRPDPAPAMNARALALAHENKSAAAIGVLRASLALNPDQEIAHFNLAWLLVHDDPAAAERHFLAAARLVPDKGGVYFGLALARHNRGARHFDAAARALALECLNDPVFLTSPWWTTPELARLRADTLRHLHAYVDRIAVQANPQHWHARELQYFAALAAWIAGAGARAAVADVATTPEREAYVANAAKPTPQPGAGPRYRRERTGYPVLMRNLDLPVPIDVFEVWDSPDRNGDRAFLFPAKGWLPSPLLLALLDAQLSPNP